MKKTLYTGLFAFAFLFMGTAPLHAACLIPVVDVELGKDNASVKLLQQFLNEKGFTISEMGVGSRGSETTYFGEKTKSAVVRFQIALGIAPAEGYVGAKTRAKMQELCLGDSVTVTKKSPLALRTVSGAQVAATGVVAEKINFTGLELNAKEARVSSLREILRVVPSETNKACAKLDIVSTVFDKTTESCLKSFQELRKLKGTGEVDEKTNRALNSMFAS